MAAELTRRELIAAGWNLLRRFFREGRLVTERVWENLLPEDSEDSEDLEDPEDLGRLEYAQVDGSIADMEGSE